MLRRVLNLGPSTCRSMPPSRAGRPQRARPRAARRRNVGERARRRSSARRRRPGLGVQRADRPSGRRFCRKMRSSKHDQRASSSPGRRRRRPSRRSPRRAPRAASAAMLAWWVTRSRISARAARVARDVQHSRRRTSPRDQRGAERRLHRLRRAPRARAGSRCRAGDDARWAHGGEPTSAPRDAAPPGAGLRRRSAALRDARGPASPSGRALSFSRPSWTPTSSPDSSRTRSRR
jgi:hypothetical protein